VEDEKVRKDALDFVRSCLQWLPKDRMSAKDLVKHPFLEDKKSVDEKPSLWKA
jgi:serine/threonine protein kinase